MFDLIEIIVERFILENPMIFLYLFLCGAFPCMIYKLSTVLIKRKTEKLSFQKLVWSFIFLLYLVVIYHLAQIGILEQFDELLVLDFTISYHIPVSSFLMVIPLGVFLPLIWLEFRSFKKFISVTLCFLLLILISRLFAFWTLELGYFSAHVMGIISGYLGFKYTYIFFHKGIAFCPSSTSTFLNRHEAAIYLFLSFAGVFLFYRPTSAMVHLSNQHVQSVTVLGYEMRNVVLIPISEFELPDEEIEDEVLQFPENAYIIWIEDLEGEFFGGVALCVILGTCYEGVLENMNQDVVSISVYPMRTIIVEDPNHEESQLLACDLHENQDFLLCIEMDQREWHGIPLIAEVDQREDIQFLLTDETIFEMWITDGFGGNYIRDFGTRSELENLLFPPYTFMRIYAVKNNGRYEAEKVAFFDQGLIFPPRPLIWNEGLEYPSPDRFPE